MPGLNTRGNAGRLGWQEIYPIWYSINLAALQTQRIKNHRC